MRTAEGSEELDGPDGQHAGVEKMSGPWLQGRQMRKMQGKDADEAYGEWRIETDGLKGNG